MKRLLSPLLVVALVAAFVLTGASTASAGTVTGPVIIECLGIDGFGATFLPDRDNTGTGQEAYTFYGYDGSGKTIFEFSAARAVGVPIPFGAASWTSAPEYNPLTLRMTSHAGNGFPEQIIFEVTGNCAGLPTYAPPVPPFSGPGLPSARNLVLFVGDTAILDGPGGNPIGLAMRTCKTAFIVQTSADGRFGRLFVQGGWVDLNATMDVPDDYGQPGGAPIYPPCVGR